MSDNYVNSTGLFTNGTHTTTWSGPWASAQSGNVKYELRNDYVILNIPLIASSATISAKISIDTVLPVALRPARVQQIIMLIADVATNAVGIVEVSTTGAISIYKDVSLNSFSGSGIAAMSETLIQYQLS